MSVEVLTAKLEGDAVLADLSLASTTHALLQRMEEHPILRGVKLQLMADPADIAGVLDRARYLFDSPAPEGYAHPSDLAVAAYLNALSTVPDPIAQEFLDRVAASSRREFFRATATARY